jgi:glycine amidinotransferase/scyllo-inosamine-4-phosphate amidinotransferase 1
MSQTREALFVVERLLRISHQGLREVIVGNPANARIPRRDRSMWLNLYGDLPQRDVARVRTGRFPDRVIEESREDLQVLTDALRGLGVTVHQVPASDHSREFGPPQWRSDGFYSYCPRDLTLIVGSLIIETPSPMRARYFELFSLRPLLQQYMLNGSGWIAAPKPQLSEELFGEDGNGLPTLGESEPAFEAANVLRCGADLFYQVSGSGNELGRVWLERTLRAYGDFTIHPLRGAYDLTHIDSTISILRPGLVLLNPARVNEANMPDALRRWDVLWCPPMADAPVSTRHPLSSPWIGMNLLMVDPGLAIVDADQQELIAALERRGICVLPLVLRHARALAAASTASPWTLSATAGCAGTSTEPRRRSAAWMGERERDHVANVGGTGQGHQEPLDAHDEAACRRHPTPGRVEEGGVQGLAVLRRSRHLVL